MTLAIGIHVMPYVGVRPAIGLTVCLALHALLFALAAAHLSTSKLDRPAGEQTGRQLTRVEQGWVDEYLLAEPRFRRYEAHLKAGALGGVRPAAVEYTAVFDSREFFDLAERMAGEVDADRMAQIAVTPDARAAWLRTAAEGGSESALRTLARGGEVWAQEQLAEQGDIGALRDVAERTVEHGDLMRAWTWQHLALLHGVDLTVSTMRAYHDGGPQHGEFYDGDFGGAMYADGDEGLRLPPLAIAEDLRARSFAHEIYGGARQRFTAPHLRPEVDAAVPGRDAA